jgi:hypothetical protein
MGADTGEKNTMTSFKISTQAQSSPKRTVTAVATFVLTTAFTLASASTATTASAPTTNRHTSTSAATHHRSLCDRDNPGICDGRWPRTARMAVTPSESTGITSGNPAISPSHDGPLCGDVPGAC